MRKQPTQIIKKLKMEIFILFSIIIFLGIIFILDFNGRGSVIALTGNYNKQSGDQLTADDWNKLDEDFLGVNTSVLGSSIIKEVPNAKLNINGYADSGELQLKTNINPSHWAIYAHKDYGDLNFWYNANLLTIDKDNGNVGIGDNSPDKKLSVNGDIKASGGIEATADIKTDGDVCGGANCLSQRVCKWYGAADGLGNCITADQIIEFGLTGICRFNYLAYLNNYGSILNWGGIGCYTSIPNVAFLNSCLHTANSSAAEYYGCK